MNLSSLSSGCTISMAPAANNRHPCKECGDIFNDEKSLELHNCIHAISRDLGHLTTSRPAPFAPSSFSSTASSTSSSSSNLFVNNVTSTFGTNTTFSRMPMTTNESMCAEVLANIIDLHVRNKTQTQQGGNYGSFPQQVNSAQSDSNDGVPTATVLSASFFKCSSCDKTFSSQGCLDAHVKTHQNPKLRCEEVLADILQTKMKGKESVIASLGAAKAPHNICKYVFYSSTLSDKSVLDVHSGMHRHDLFNKKSPPAKQELKGTICDDEFDDITSLKMNSKNHNHELLNLDSASKTLSTKKKNFFSNETRMAPAKKDTFLLSNKNVFQLGNKEENKPTFERILGARDTTDQTKPELKRTSKAAFAVSIGLNTSSKRKYYKCTSCKEAFEELASLKNHSASHHSSLPPNDSSSPPQRSFVSPQPTTTSTSPPTCPPPAKFKCTFCNKDFLNLISLETHAKSHPEPQSSFKCSYCSDTFTNFGLFSKHLQGHVKKDRSDSAAKMARLLDKSKTGGKQNVENGINKPCVTKVGTALTKTVTEAEENEEEGSSKKRARKTGGYITKKNEDDDLNMGIAKIQTAIAATVDTSSSTTSVIDPTPCAHGNNATTKDIKNNSNSNQNPNANSNFTPRVKFVTPRSLFKCTYCNKEFSKLGKLKRHIRIHTGEKPYKCPNCQKCFTQSGNLTHHLRTHNGDKPYACNTCSKSFSQSSSLTIHKRSHTGERPFACSYCDKRFSHSGPLNHHIRTHTGEKPFKCQFCDKAFPQSSQLRQHVRTHTGEKPYKCTLCLKNFTQSSSLNIHLRSHTGERPFKCQHCEKSFAQSGKLHQHAKIHMAEKTVNCPWPSCTKEVLSSKLTSHLWTHLKGAADKEQPLKCDICDRVFKQVSSLSQHLQLHTGEKRYECQKCEKVFSQANKLNVHRKAAHAGERPYKCWFCVKTFPQPADLTLHERTHTGEKPYTCDICQRGFSQTGSLSRHRRIHTGEKPFECKMCEKAFSQSSGLAQHMKTHTQEKPYSCKYCCKAFSFSSKLKEHLTIHTNEKPFRCKVCSKQFRSSSNLSNHKKHCSEADNSSRQKEDPPTCNKAKEKSSSASKIELSQSTPINQSEGISQIETVTTSVPGGNIGIDSVAERNRDTEVGTSSSDFQPQTQSLGERTLEEDMELKPNLSSFTDSELAHIYTFTVRVIGNKNNTVTSEPITEASLDDPSQAPVKNGTNINTIVTSNGPHLAPEETLSTDLATTTTSSQVDIFVSHNEEVSDSGGIQLSLPQSPSENVDGLALLEQEVTCFPKNQASTANIDAGPILDNCAAYVIQATLPTISGRDSVACSEESGSKTIVQTTVPSSPAVADIQADSISNLDLAVSVLEPKSSATEECYQSNHVSSSSDENVLEMQAYMPNSCKEPIGSNYDPQKLLQGTVEQQRIGSNSSIYSDPPVVLENSVSLRSIRLIEDGSNFSSVHHVAHLYEMSYSVTPQELGENPNIDTTCNLTNTTTTVDKNNSHGDIIASSICSSSSNNNNNNNNDNNNNKSLLLVPYAIPRVASETTVENTVNSSSACKDFSRVSITEEEAVTGSHDVITTNVVSALADLS